MNAKDGGTKVFGRAVFGGAEVGGAGGAVH